MLEPQAAVEAHQPLVLLQQSLQVVAVMAAQVEQVHLILIQVQQSLMQAAVVAVLEPQIVHSRARVVQAAEAQVTMQAQA
jgi:hypothetical protein